jgi:hypothetical protein
MLDAGIPMPAASASVPMPNYGKYRTEQWNHKRLRQHGDKDTSYRHAYRQAERYEDLQIAFVHATKQAGRNASKQTPSKAISNSMLKRRYKSLQGRRHLRTSTAQYLAAKCN